MFPCGQLRPWELPYIYIYIYVERERERERDIERERETEAAHTAEEAGLVLPLPSREFCRLHYYYDCYDYGCDCYC